MKEAVYQIVQKLKDQYPEMEEQIMQARECYSQEVEREGFFIIDRLKGEFSQPLKQNDELDLDSILAAFCK